MKRVVKSESAKIKIGKVISEKKFGYLYGFFQRGFYGFVV
jgi:hypothetical protein